MSRETRARFCAQHALRTPLDDDDDDDDGLCSSRRRADAHAS